MIIRDMALFAIIVPVTLQAQESFPCTPRTGSGNTFGIEEINELWSLIQGSRTPREAESKVGDRFGSTLLTFVETIENKKISIIIDQIGMDSINQLTRAPFSGHADEETTASSQPHPAQSRPRNPHSSCILQPGCTGNAKHRFRYDPRKGDAAECLTGDRGPS